MQEKLEKRLSLEIQVKMGLFFLFFLYHQTVDELERGSSCRISMTCQHTKGHCILLVKGKINKPLLIGLVQRGKLNLKLTIILQSPKKKTKVHIYQPIQDFLDFQYQGGVKSTVSGVFEDLKFKRGNAQKGLLFSTFGCRFFHFQPVLMKLSANTS